VPFLDSTAANTIEGMAHKAARKNVAVYLTGTTHDIRRDLFAQGIKPPLVHYARRIEDAIRKAGAER
jgi:sulfate permease, SulP family